MAKKRNKENQIILLLRSSVNTILGNKDILLPFSIIAFLQLLILEILYFYPRFPLNKIFGPVVQKIWSAEYLHYPYNFILLPKLFQYAQIPIYILISSYFIAVAIVIIKKINEDKTVKLRSVIVDTFASYVHIVVASIISFLAVMLLFKLYDILYSRAMIIKSQTGIYYFIKNVVMGGAPYFKLILSVFITTLFAFVLPIIVLEKKKITSALKSNFIVLKKSAWFLYLVILIPHLFYVPVLLLRNAISINNFQPALIVFLLVLTVFVLVAIDAVVYTAITLFYLLKREEL